jgi:hypothetical protein
LSDRPTAPSLSGLVAVPTYRDHPATAASDLSGLDANGTPHRVQILGTDRFTLLLFLSTGCDGCHAIFEGLGSKNSGLLSGDEDVVVVARSTENPEEFIQLVPSGIPVIFSGSGWEDYAVHGPPFFVLVDGAANRVITEGVAWGAAQVGEQVAGARRGSVGLEVPRLIPPED